MAWEADVYQGDLLAAHIERTPQGSRLHFDPDFLATAPTYPGFLAWRLPYAEPDIDQKGDNLHPFFWNLLPEGARLQLLFQNNRLAKDDFLGMLLKVGWDTIGDIAVLPHGEAPQQHHASAHVRNLKEISFWEEFNKATGADPDAAVPGVQEKISAATIAFPVKGIGQPAKILKLNPKAFPMLVQNEDFFLHAALFCGIKVNKAQLVEDREGETGLLIDRFDRVRNRKVMRKLHQEDVCQLTNTSPANKYHVAFRDAVEAVREVSSAPRVETSRLLNLYAFSYLIGNSDLHAKNISVLWPEDQTIRLSPAYDLLSTLPYKELDQRMAMKMDGKDANFKADDFVRFGERYDLYGSIIRGHLEIMCNKIRVAIQGLELIGFDKDTVDSMRATILKRADALSA